ncbi:hypothetical protein HK100_002408 [Physocladia obscura]|uniref:BZIP domain-containing protein n=1 Tax=Physocladia obscura TaxID=109957 RepID=A0AAD5SVF3_9FUNG|nr:hypothetical protein HK100_002408 [Physocladia obscura]
MQEYAMYADSISAGSMDGLDSMDAISSEQFFVPSLQTLESLAAFAVKPNSTGKNNKAKNFVVSAENDNGSVTSNSNNHKRKKTKKELEREKYELDESGKPKRGRKLAQDEPVSRRLAQNRVAQRAFRERKVNQVKTLETRVAELEDMLAAATSVGAAPSTTVSATAPAVDPKFAKEIASLKALVADLEERNVKLEAEAQQLRQMVFTFNPQQQQQQPQQNQQLSPFSNTTPFLSISPDTASFPYLATSTASMNDFMATAFSFDSLLASSPSTVAPPTIRSTSNMTEIQDILFDNSMFDTILSSSPFSSNPQQQPQQQPQSPVMLPVESLRLTLALESSTSDSFVPRGVAAIVSALKVIPSLLNQQRVIEELGTQMADYVAQFNISGTGNPSIYTTKLKELKARILAACGSNGKDAQTVAEIFRVAKEAFAMFCQDRMLSIK